MKRLALPLAVAAAVLGGTGCGSTCTNGTALVSWTGFDDASGAVNVPCGAAGVASVDLWLDNQFVGNWPCTDYGAAVPGVPTGGNIVDVEGIAPDGSTILFRDSISFTQACGNVGLPAYPGQGTATLTYAFQSGSGGYCTSGSTYMWFTIFDDIAGAPDPASAGNATGTPRQWPCGPTDPVVTLPNGQYELRNVPPSPGWAGGPAMSAMIEGPPGTFTEGASTCNAPITFTVTSGSSTPVHPSLADLSAVCL